MAGGVVLKTGLTAMVLIGALLLAGCGKKGPPSAPGPQNEIIWPRSYPTH
jgi:hypothetical protein